MTPKHRNTAEEIAYIDALTKDINDLDERICMLENKMERNREVEMDMDEVMNSLAPKHSGTKQFIKLLKRFEERINTLEKILKPEDIEVIELRDIPRSQAKAEICEYFKDGKYHDVGEVADKLRLDIQLVFEICNELIEEGTIGG